ncbi:MAG: pyridoxal-dependent decarboxylase [Acidobacteriota bacterium]
MTDVSPDALRAALHRASDLIVDYLTTIDDRPVVPSIEPGTVRDQLPPSAPDAPEPLDRLIDDVERLIVPNLTHWNHPGFLAYFSSSGSGPGIVGELLAAGLSVNGMLWRTAPAAVELEQHVCDWLRQLIDLPEPFRGHINDTASSSTLVALAAARDAVVPQMRARGPAASDAPLIVYTSAEAHSSIDKAIITLGLGLDQLRRVPVDEAMRLDIDALRRQIADDRAAGLRPMAVMATAGTTSTTSVDPIDRIADVCRDEGLWLHVDAAWAGAAAICAELRPRFAGMERADSVVINPHKWMFVPLDCSVLFVRDEAQLRRAFSLVPAYLETDAAEAVHDPMDLGFQLGRRFRALKLWFVLRAFGADGLRDRLRQHIALGRQVADWVDADPGFERLAPVPFSTVCFRARPTDAADAPDDEALDRLNARVLAHTQADGAVFLSHTRVRGCYALRLSVSHLRTEAHHVARAWQLLREARQAALAEIAS